MSDVTITLDRYERDNLLALLHLISHLPSALTSLANGDWTNQIIWKLAERGYDPSVHKPNMMPEEQLKMLVGRSL